MFQKTTYVEIRPILLQCFPADDGKGSAYRLGWLIMDGITSIFVWISTPTQSVHTTFEIQDLILPILVV